MESASTPPSRYKSINPKEYHKVQYTSMAWGGKPYVKNFYTSERYVKEIRFILYV